VDILGFHIICTTYGFWLPNDERGSGSDYVRAPHLQKFGPATRVTHGRSVAYRPFDREIRKLARETLRFPHVEWNGQQALAVAQGFKRELAAHGGKMLACAVLRDHFHVVVPPPRYDIRRFAGRLKSAATRQLSLEGLHPLQSYKSSRGNAPSPWARLPWVVFLFTNEDMRRGIRYVDDNPVKARLPRQKWSFVTPYDGY
jgi:REP element-mobilizing transposase RayT